MTNPHLSASNYVSPVFYVLLLLVIGFLAGCGSTQKATPEPREQPEPPTEPIPEEPAEPEEPVEKEQPPGPQEMIDPADIPETPREMRAAWIASVANIDWPSEPGLPVVQQKAELRAQFDHAVQLNMNAVFLQVRPAADALYDSPYEPWSEFLTGKQGKPPKPYYDPLAFAVKEAHRRGLELHAWFNPFRAFHYEGESEFASNHIKNEQPNLVKEYGRYWWIDPGWEAARRYSRKVIVDVARRYDIDGVHLDDYFYSYAEVDAQGQNIPFPDDGSYQAYVQEHGQITKGDWRRQNINRFVKNLNTELKKVKPHIRFGISPFGIWRPGNPPQIKGFDAYANLYADAKKWFNEGWVDYLVPQLYWPIDQQAQSFPVLLEWWEKQNTFNRHLWAGLYTSRVGRNWNAKEIGRQIAVTRKQQGAGGNVHFSMQSIMDNSGGIADLLLTQSYTDPALVPASGWLSTKRPPQPQASLKKVGKQFIITRKTNQNKNLWLWVVKSKYGSSWHIKIIPGWKQSITLPAKRDEESLVGVVLNAVNEVGNKSVEQMLLPTLERVEQR